MSAQSLFSMLAAPAASGVAPTSGASTAEGEFGALLAGMTGALTPMDAAPTAKTSIATGRVSGPPVEAVNEAETDAVATEETVSTTLSANAAAPAALPSVPTPETVDVASDEPAEAEPSAPVDAAPVPVAPVPAAPVPAAPIPAGDAAFSASASAPAADSAASVAPSFPMAPVAPIANLTEAVETGSPSGAAPAPDTIATTTQPAQARSDAAVLAALPRATPALVVPAAVARRAFSAPVAESVNAVAPASSRPAAPAAPAALSPLPPVAPASREPAPSVADRASGRTSESATAPAGSAAAPLTAPTPPSGVASPAAVAVAAPAIDTPMVAAPVAEATTAPTPQAAPAASAPATTPAASVNATLSTLSHTAIEATAQIAAQITRRLEGRSTRFEMALSPEGLGRVDVSLDIDADGQLSARLAFDNPLAATDLRGRADELRRQLEDAGFTLARDALDFAERDASSSGQGFDRRQGRAFAEASRRNDDAEAAIPAPAAWISLSLTPQGVDMKV